MKKATVVAALSLAWAALIARPIEGQSAVRDTVVRIIGFHESSLDWLSFHSARLAVQEFGLEAGAAAQSVLDMSSPTSQPWRTLLGAIRITAYEASGFPIEQLQDLASGRHSVSPDANRNYGFRLAALRALASRPRPSLDAYWRGLLSNSYVEVRRAAVTGLSCALGRGALTILRDVAATDRDSTVAQLASYRRDQLIAAGDSARVCLYGLWTRSQAEQSQVPIDSGLAKRAELYFGFRRQR
jgi:hypothetical protein